MNLEQFLSQQKARENIYKILSVLYYSPEEDILESEILDNLVQSCELISSELKNIARELKEEFINIGDFKDLKVDHAKLFVGPFELLAPPYGSIYLEEEGTVMGDSTLEVIDEYKESGLNTDQNFKEAPDHVIAELEFLYYLVFNSIKELQSEDYQEALDYLQTQKNFLTKHLGAWVVEFSAKIKKHAKTEVYKNLAKLTESFVNQDLNDILEESASQLQELIDD